MLWPFVWSTTPFFTNMLYAQTSELSLVFFEYTTLLCALTPLGQLNVVDIIAGFITL
jgi:hypothetical protein